MATTNKASSTIVYFPVFERSIDGMSHDTLLGAGVLGDGLGALGHGVLGELPGQHQAHGGLDLPGGDRGPGRRQG